MSFNTDQTNLIIIGHPNKKSFCYNGIFKTIYDTLLENNENVEVIDLYRDDFTRENIVLISNYKDKLSSANQIYLISPVWWFRCVPLVEMFFDEVFTPEFAFKFIPVVGLYGYPKPLLAKKTIRTYLTHGAPALPVMTIFLNSVKLRLVMGVYSFVFGWKLSIWFKTKQFFSVPFIANEKRKKFLRAVKKDVIRDLKRVNKKLDKSLDFENSNLERELKYLILHLNSNIGKLNYTLIKKEINKFKEINNLENEKTLDRVNDSQLFNLFLSIDSDIDEIEALKKQALIKKNNILMYKNIKREVNRKRNRFVSKIKNLNFKDYLTDKKPIVSDKFE